MNYYLEGNTMPSNTLSPRFTLNNRCIGPHEPVYIIAEMACAHDGDLGKAKALIDAAAEAQADAIQLQFFSVHDMVTPGHDAYELLLKIEFTPNEWNEIYQRARQSGMDVFACAYDLPSARLAIEFQVDGIKLNSADLSNPFLLQAAAESGIPYTIGTGASTFEEIAQALDTSLNYGGNKIVLMHGIQNFPTELSQARIRRIQTLKQAFPCPVGYQDHTDAANPFSRYIDLIALGMGIQMLEKHITLNRSEKGTDYQAALEPNEFREYVQRIRLAEQALGEPRMLPLNEKDHQYRRFQKKSIVAKKDIKPGEQIALESLNFLRTRTPGLPPSEYKTIVGKQAKHSMKQYTLISMEDVE